jgi:hypothetical protein
MDKERFKERILETENLTDELEDADANTLLDWGVSQLDAVLQNSPDVETSGSRVNALMAVMRKINRIVGSYADKTPESLAEDLSSLRDLCITAFASAAIPVLEKTPAEYTAAAESLSAMTPRQALEFLTGFFFRSGRKIRLPRYR